MAAEPAAAPRADPAMPTDPAMRAVRRLLAACVAGVVLFALLIGTRSAALGVLRDQVTYYAVFLTAAAALGMRAIVARREGRDPWAWALLAGGLVTTAVGEFVFPCSRPARARRRRRRRPTCSTCWPSR